MCPSPEQLQRFFDDELAAPDRGRIAAHLEECSQCRAELAQLGALSAVLKQSAVPELLPIAMARLQQRISRVTDRSLMRLAWAMSSVAAVVLVGGLMLLQASTATAQASSTPVQGAPPWVEALSAGHPLSRNATSPAAAWYLADASSRSDELP